MSKSIRSYFTVTKKQSKVTQDDSDEIPESPDVQIKNKKKQSRKKRLIEDSDEEIFSPKKKKIEKTPQSKNQKSPKPALKEVTITDLFGNAKIKKTEALVVKDKISKKTETGIHSDDEFEKSLLELDEPKEVNIKSPDNKKLIENKCHPQIDENFIKEEVIEEKIKHNNNDKLSKVNEKSFKEKANEKKMSTHDTDKLLKSNEKIKKKNHGEKTYSDDFTSQHASDDKKSSLIKKQNHEITSDKGIKKNRETNIDIKSSNSHNKVDINEDIQSNKKDKKRELSEFLESDDNNETTSKKKKHDTSLNDSVLTDEERHERKRHSAALYQKYLNRTGPKHLGSKEIPEGAPNCLKDCAFLLTGVLDSFEREEIVEAVTKYGGTIKSGISKKVTHVLAGDDAGPAKIAKAESLGIKIINEDEFLSMIAKPSSKQNSEAKKDEIKSKIKVENVDQNRAKSKSIKPSYKQNGDTKKDDIKPKIKVEHVDQDKSKKSLKDNIKSNYFEKDKSSSMKKERSVSPKKDGSPKGKIEKNVKAAKREHTAVNGTCDNEESKSSHDAPLSLMWVDKYKPTNIKQIIGQHGEASNVKKLTNWLTKWYVNRKAKLAKPNPWAKNDDGSFYKAALLSGPPGVGKTTTVSLVCKELGFDTVEFNASDTRSKNLIKEQISELLSTTSLSGFARGKTGKQAVSKKHVLVMDEVDGMAGNEDRGGLQELIALIKSTSVPIICMCNDRNSEKMRSLVNYCYDLRFSRPRVDQIKAAMMTVCFKEGVKIAGDVLSQLISAAGQDVRQTLHLLSMWSVDPQLADKERLQKEAQRVKKDIKMGPWEAIRKVFSAEEHKVMSLNDRSDLFFTDYSLAPLFVQENYLQVSPHCPKHEILDRLSKAADSLSIGDLVDARIRGSQAWSLLPIQAMYSSVIPGQVMSGHVAGQIQFPGWLGKNSRASKMARLAQGIHAHTRLSTSGSKSSIYLDYAPHLRDAILNPLIKNKIDGIQDSLRVLEEYHLLREDLESLTELSVWPGQRNPNVLVDSKVKAAMTRTYNKQASALPYAPGAVTRARHDDTHSREGEEDEMDPDSDPENDAMIKKKKTKDDKPSTSKEKGQSSKGKKKK